MVWCNSRLHKLHPSNRCLMLKKPGRRLQSSMDGVWYNMDFFSKLLNNQAGIRCYLSTNWKSSDASINAVVDSSWVFTRTSTTFHCYLNVSSGVVGAFPQRMFFDRQLVISVFRRDVSRGRAFQIQEGPWHINWTYLNDASLPTGIVETNAAAVGYLVLKHIALLFSNLSLSRACYDFMR